MVSRREWLRITAVACAALGQNPRIVEALQSREVITRGVPSTGERLPAIGLGGANTFSRVARANDFDAVGGVLRALLDGGAIVIDTAAGYGASEEVSGQVADELGIADRIFWATKVNVTGRGGGLGRSRSGSGANRALLRAPPHSRDRPDPGSQHG